MEYKQNYPVEIPGLKPGHVSVILAGIHGNEHAGVTAFETLIPLLCGKIEYGTVIFELGNLDALAKNERRGDTDLNRMFREEKELTEAQRQTSEFARSRYLRHLLKKADCLLDVHTSKNDCPPFIICENKGMEIAESLPFNMICTGFGAFEPGATDEYMDSLGKVGLCVECGQHDDPKAADLAVNAIKDFLIQAGHMTGTLSHKPRKQRKLEIFHLYKSQTADFRFERHFSEFEPLAKGTLIGHDGEEAVYARENCLIVFPVARKVVGDECFLLAKETLSEEDD